MSWSDKTKGKRAQQMIGHVTKTELCRAQPWHYFKHCCRRAAHCCTLVRMTFGEVSNLLLKIRVSL